jgi:hypothetical protein
VQQVQGERRCNTFQVQRLYPHCSGLRSVA